LRLGLKSQQLAERLPRGIQVTQPSVCDAGILQRFGPVFSSPETCVKSIRGTAPLTQLQPKAAQAKTRIFAFRCLLQNIGVKLSGFRQVAFFFER